MFITSKWIGERIAGVETIRRRHRNTAAMTGKDSTGQDMQVSSRVRDIPVSAIHEMTRLSKQYEDVAFLSWAKPNSETPAHIRRCAIEAIDKGLTSGYSPSQGLPELRHAVAEKLRRDNAVYASPSQVLVTVGAIEGLAAAVMATVDPEIGRAHV